MARQTEQTIDEWYREYDNAKTIKPNKPITGERNMSLVMKNEGGDFELIPEGTHIGRCYMVVDLGNQVTTYKGVESVKPQVLIGWELTNELMKDGRPFVASRNYNAFFSEKANLRKDLESWRGRKFTEEELAGFDISKLLTVPCQITITHSTGERTYANVSTVTGLPKGVEAPELINPAVIYDMDNPDLEAFEKLPEWIQKKVNSAVETGQVVDMPQSENPAEFVDDDIPF